MKYHWFTFLFLLLVISGCALKKERFQLVKVDQVGPVRAETWKDTKTGICKQWSVDYMYHRVVSCPEVIK